MMNRTRALTIFTGGFAAGCLFMNGIFMATGAHADPMCNFRHDCGWGEPFNGQQQQTQDTPGTYGGWTTNPIYCDPYSGACRVLVPGR
jgi:hypothetical protein